MSKIVIVINGKGGSGKDTLINAITERYDDNIVNISAIQPIKRAAELIGYDVKCKDDKSRKFLSDLKALSIEYNDYPTKYLLDNVCTFNSTNNKKLLFVHIREPEEIEKFIREVNNEYPNLCVVSLLVRRNVVTCKEFGNSSDDNVEDYCYDYVFDNNNSIEESKHEFLGLLYDIFTHMLWSDVLDGNT